MPGTTHNLAVVCGLILAACSSQTPTPPPGLFESQGTIDWDRVETLSELAEQSDIVVTGVLTGVTDGYVVGESIDDEFGSPEIELLIDVDDHYVAVDSPIRLVWAYVPGYTLADVRTVLPIGARVVLYATRFVVHPQDAGSFHHIGPDDHQHWRWTNPQGLIVEDPSSGLVSAYDDQAGTQGNLDGWLPPDDEFARLAGRGQCTELETAFAEGEPAPYTTPEDAATGLQRSEAELRGLDVAGGSIRFRGQQVGSYQVVDRPENTYDVAFARWCYPDR